MSIADLGRTEPGSLRFMTCGSVDDGKSTLIGRLLFETGRLPDDQVEKLRRDSAAQGMSGGELDYSLLLDGLAAEREQGITIDVAYRYFATDRRRFVVADTPGHEQYTRNMATGASGVELAVLLVDAAKGILAQTRRHASIAALMGVRHVVLAVNKIDLVPDAEGAFRRIEGEFAEFAASLDLLSLEAIPLSARHGDNVTTPSERFSFHRGPTLLAHLETVEVEPAPQSRPLRMPVQWIARGESNVRGLCGTIASGEVRPGDEIVVAGSGASARIAAILDKAGDRPVAVAGEAVTLRLDREIDASRGDVLAAASDRPEVSDQFAAHLVWMDEEPLLPGRAYLMKLGPAQVAASVTRIKHRIDVDTFKPLAAGTLALNDIGQVNLSLNEPVAFEPYRTNRALGAFILIDRLSDRTVAAGMIDFSLRRAANIHRQAVDVDKAARAAAKHQRPVLLWFTGLSGAGKSTVANLVEKRLFALGHHTYLLDGDNVRHGLNRDLGFTVADRVENIRRVAETAKLMVDAGLITLASFISPFRAERRMARELLGEEFVEIFVDAPLAVAETRDPKGLYRQARAGKIPNFTGIDSPYEEPEAAEIHLRTDQRTAPELADEVIAFLREKGFLTRPEIET